jgi:hypothetical protein
MKCLGLERPDFISLSSFGRSPRTKNNDAVFNFQPIKSAKGGFQIPTNRITPQVIHSRSVNSTLAEG